jgi:cytochrome b561
MERSPKHFTGLRRSWSSSRLPEVRVYAPARDFDRQIHETLGLTVFALTVLRVLWIIVDRRPEPQAMPRWMVIASKSVQGALYLLLFAVPITAILGAWLEGHALTLLAGITLQPGLGMSHDIGATLAKLHTQLGDIILWLAGLHALAALYHHIVLKDGVCFHAG